MTSHLDPAHTAIILVGYQNDYFAPDGVLHKVVEASTAQVLANTLILIKQLESSKVSIISTPILFTQDYQELVDPIGILKIIKDTQAFRADTQGGETIPELRAFGDRITEVPGKRGLNAFSNTHLLELLRSRNISNVVLMGVVTSLCIESTGREAFEHGFHVFVVSDATAGRTDFEQEFYCSEIFPMYAEVLDHSALLASMHS